MKLRNAKETNPPKFMASPSRERSETPPPPEEPYHWGTADDMRNWVCPEVNPHMIDTLRDVHPHTLEETFHWYARVRFCFRFFILKHHLIPFLARFSGLGA